MRAVIAAAMQLAERGKLDLDAPIQTWVPSFPQKPWPITARELLGHLSGIRHCKTPGETLGTSHYTDLLAPLKLFEDDPLLFEPDTRYGYSTYGYNLLGAAVEAASGKEFLDYLRENIFSPARMEQIRQDDVCEIVPHRARGYRWSNAAASGGPATRVRSRASRRCCWRCPAKAWWWCCWRTWRAPTWFRSPSAWRTPCCSSALTA